jgi:hypothetical protein
MSVDKVTGRQNVTLLVIILPWIHANGDALVVAAFFAKLFALWVDLAVSV